MTIAFRRKEAFLAQARSDLAAYQSLCRTPLPSCHRLHYLQMFCEKLCKAHMWSGRHPQDGRPEFLTSHAVIAKVLPQLVRDYMVKRGAPTIDMAEVRQICREIELLAPAVDNDGRRPDNAEYPWAILLDGQPAVQPPCTARFAVEGRLRNHVGRQLLKAAFAIADAKPA